MTGGNTHNGVADWMIRRALVACDLLAVTVAWTAVLAAVRILRPDSHPAPLVGAWAALGIGVTTVVLSRSQIYRTHVLAVRAVEMLRVGRSCLVSAAVLVAVDRVLGSPLGWAAIAAGGAACYGLLLIGRGAVELWSREARRDTEPARSLLMIDDPDDVRRTVALLTDSPELGYRLVGYVSDRRALTDAGIPWLGTPGDLRLLTELTAVTGVLVTDRALHADVVRSTVSQLQDMDVHVHVITHDGRIRVLPADGARVATPPATGLTRAQRLRKRLLDVCAGAVLAAVAAPVVGLAALALRAVGGRPALVREPRLGPGGERLQILRLRVSDLPQTAAARMVGRLCRRLCVAELPQLAQVVAGSMSLVGPRPRPIPRHIPRGTAAHAAPGTPPAGMHAGLIGLRHVEPRGYPEHRAYRRLDHFYAENWSLGLDVSIVTATAMHVLWRLVRMAVCDDGHATVH